MRGNSTGPAPASLKALLSNTTKREPGSRVLGERSEFFRSLLACPRSAPQRPSHPGIVFLAIDRPVSPSTPRREIPLPVSGFAADYAARLLADLGVSTSRSVPIGERVAPHPQFDWARSGAMALSGHADGAPLLAPASLSTTSRRAWLSVAMIPWRISAKPEASRPRARKT